MNLARDRLPRGPIAATLGVTVAVLMATVIARDRVPLGVVLLGALCIDELSLGLAPAVVTQLVDVVPRRRRGGAASTIYWTPSGWAATAITAPPNCPPGPGG